MAQNNDSPGKRLKREEAKNTLYVSNPNDPRLQMYQDSLAAAVPAILANKQIRYMNTLSMPKRREYYENVFYERGNEKADKRFEFPMSSYEAQFRLEKSNKKPYKTGPNKNVTTYIEPPNNYQYEFSNKQGKGYSGVTELGLVEHLPKRKVVFRPEEPIEPLQPRQDSSPILTREEIIAPVPRPVEIPPASPIKEPVMEEEDTITESLVARKPPKAVMPRRAGGWANQPLLMRLFPKLYER